MKNEQHLFFLHEPTLNLASLHVGGTITCSPHTSTRTTTILRLRVGEKVTLFAHNICATITLATVVSGKKSLVTGIVEQIEEKKPFIPNIILVCGMVKASTCEDICYTATQLGVAQIIPIKTDKSYTKTYTEKDFSRFHAQCVAAAEQSKQIFLPQITQPQLFSEIVKKAELTTHSLFFEANGTPLQQSVKAIDPTQTITLFFGPEGGFSTEEQLALETNNGVKTALCKSILRTQDAILLGIGALRSIL